jgi:hypothetical protein
LTVTAQGHFCAIQNPNNIDYVTRDCVNHDAWQRWEDQLAVPCFYPAGSEVEKLEVTGTL